MEESATTTPKQPTPWHMTEFLGMGFIMLYVVAMLFPDAWWGMHFLSFLPNAASILLLIIAVALVFGSRWSDKLPSYELGLTPLKRTIAFAVIAVAVGTTFYNLTVFTPFYGDSVKFSSVLGKSVERPSSFHWNLFLSMDLLEGKIGERTVLNGAVLFARAIGVDNLLGYRVLTALLGGIYAFIALLFSYRYFNTLQWRTIFAVLFITSPIVLNFCGNVEIYAPTTLMFSAFLMALLLYFKTSNAKFILLSIPLLIIAFKLHISSQALTLGLITAIIHWLLRNKTTLRDKLFNWKTATLAAILPAIIIGCIVYFGVLEDHTDPRFLVKELSVYERVFLPLFSPEAPLDRYNLLSFNHIFDYFNQMMIWSSAGMVLLFAFLFGLRKKINWNKPEIVVLGVLIIVYWAFFFMVNPLLGMPVDSDLLAIPAPLFILFLATIAQQFDEPEMGKKFLGPVLAVSLLGIMILPVSASQSMLSHRMESIGSHIMRTYWITAGEDIILGLMLEEDENEFVNRNKAVIQNLEPYAVEGIDMEYGELVRRFADYYRKSKRNPQAALPLHLKTLKYHPKSGPNYLGLMETYFMLGDMQNSLKYAEQMLAFNYPNREKALSICVHVALEAEAYDAALHYASIYMQEFQGNEKMQFVYDNLKLGKDLPELKKVFNGS